MQNAIENNFLSISTLNIEEDKILKRINSDIQTVYIKVLLEITKENKI